MSEAVEIPAPFVGRPSTWNPIFRAQMSDFFRSDHYPFWEADPSLPAVFLTDTAENRGFMEQCYHQSCDDFSHVTPDMITFLEKTTDSIAKAVSRMTNETCEMKKTGMGIIGYDCICLIQWLINKSTSVFHRRFS